MSLETCTVGQEFGFNFNPSYAAGGLNGHTGRDRRCGYGSPIYSPHDMFIYKVLTVAHPSNDGTGFTGIFGIVDNGVECYEYLIGHCDPLVTEGQFVKKGDLIGTEANHGEVYAGGVRITLAMQKAGNKEGSHRHEQKRPVRRVARLGAIKTYLTESYGGPYRDKQGMYYEVWYQNNGYNGCVDELLPLFNRTLLFGSSGYDVWCLQRLLIQKRILLQGYDTGNYYGKTFDAVSRFQNFKGLSPVGMVGPKTRAALEALLPN